MVGSKPVSTFYYGGQAVIEGVMMRGRRRATTVVRRPDGELVWRSESLPGALYRGAARLPLVRGLVTLWEMLILGTRMLLFSAAAQSQAEMGEELPKGLVAGMMLLSVTFAVGLFFILPLILAAAGTHALGNSLWSNLAEGVIRLTLFLGYLWLIGRTAKMRRLFEYHGAEHKTVNAYESGGALTPATVQQYSTIHVRCGTAFLLWVVVLSIFVFALIGHPPLLVGIAARVVLVPLIAAIGYEILRAGARFQHIRLVWLALQPGLWLQRLTTRQPSDDQVAVAIAALSSVLEADGAPLCLRSAPVIPALEAAESLT